MQAFRIAKTRYINDLTGTGSRIYGGRWNHPGVNMLYTSENRALATVEYLVHASAGLMPLNLSIATIHIPDALISSEILVTQLPDNWRHHPAPSPLADLGTNWVQSNATPLLRVPSAVVEHENNILINPTHPDMKQISIIDIQPYTFDVRLLQ